MQFVCPQNKKNSILNLLSFLMEAIYRAAQGKFLGFIIIANTTKATSVTYTYFKICLYFWEIFITKEVCSFQRNTSSVRSSYWTRIYKLWSIHISLSYYQHIGLEMQFTPAPTPNSESNKQKIDSHQKKQEQWSIFYRQNSTGIYNCPLWWSYN